jgi:hypothetical protein
MAKADLTAQRLRTLLSYDRETGVFRWTVRTSNRISIGDVAGNPLATGYLQICIDGHTHTAHRLAWLYVHGVWPSGQIDHLDGVRTNNAIGNLRDVPAKINRQNLRLPRSDNKSSSYLGVTFSKRRQRWIAQIFVDGKHIHIGQFLDEQSAAVAYVAAKRRLHVGCTI